MTSLLLAFYSIYQLDLITNPHVQVLSFCQICARKFYVDLLVVRIVVLRIIKRDDCRRWNQINNHRARRKGESSVESNIDVDGVLPGVNREITANVSQIQVASIRVFFRRIKHTT